MFSQFRFFLFFLHVYRKMFLLTLILTFVSHLVNI